MREKLKTLWTAFAYPLVAGLILSCCYPGAFDAYAQQPVSEVTPLVEYTAAASQTEFPYTWPVFDDDDLVVRQYDGTSWSTLTKTTQYTVSGVCSSDGSACSGGNVTLVTGADSGDKVRIYLDAPLERSSTYHPSGLWNRIVLDQDFSKLVEQNQSQQLEIDRSLRVAMTDADIDPFDMAANASKCLKINSAGTNIEAAECPADTSATAASLGAFECIDPTSSTYGADPTGATDSTTAIQSALDEAAPIDAAGNMKGTANVGIVCLPGGEFLFTQLEVPWGTHLVGKGAGSFGIASANSTTMLRQIDDTNLDGIVFRPKAGGTAVGYVRIADMVLRGDDGGSAGSGTVGSAIKFVSTGGTDLYVDDQTELHNLQIRGWPGSGVEITRGGAPFVIRNVSTLFNRQYGFYVDGGGDIGVTANAMLFENVLANGHQNAGFYFTDFDTDNGTGTDKSEIVLESVFCEMRPNTSFPVNKGSGGPYQTGTGDPVQDVCIQFHAVETAAASVVIDGLAQGANLVGTPDINPEHYGTKAAILITGSASEVPDIQYSGVSTRLHANQVQGKGAPPLTLWDQTTASGTNGLLDDPPVDTDGDATPNINHTGHGFAQDDYVFLQGITDCDGIPAEELTGLHRITAVPDADHYTIETTTSASGTSTCGDVQATNGVAVATYSHGENWIQNDQTAGLYGYDLTYSVACDRRNGAKCILNIGNPLPRDSNAPLGAGVKIQGGDAGLLIWEQDGPADEKGWQLRANNGQLDLFLINDENVAGDTPIKISRTGADNPVVKFDDAAIALRSWAVTSTNPDVGGRNWVQHSGSGCPLTDLTSGVAGQVVAVEFTGACTVNETGNFKLSATSHAADDDDILMLLNVDGTVWHEISFAAN